ncbi:MAG: esterase-like activity of phytase family protein [Rhodoferax sp.]|nr:esterase-like activity of phytase family protein [Rhodoferax sp.]
MNQKSILSLVLATLFVASPAQATPALIAIGALGGTSDLSGLTGNLENGVAGNILGGLGSGLAWAGGNTFIATPDRGPNATPYNSQVDDTTSYVSRFQTLQLNLNATANGTLPYTLTTSLAATTLLSSNSPLTYGSGAGLNLPNGAPLQNTAGNYYFTGRSDNFATGSASNNANNGRFDPEGVRISRDGKSVFISDEYGPYVYQFDRATGQRIRSFELPANLAATRLSAQGADEISGNATGRVANKGMEGLAITPDGSTLIGIMQAPLAQDKNKVVRIVTIDIATGATHEYAYRLTTGSGVSEIVALNNHQFLVDERDGKGLGDGSSASVKQLFRIDLTGATEVSHLTGSAADQVALKAAAVQKTLVLDLVSALTAYGIPTSDIPSKIEGLAFGEDITINGETLHTLYVANDNDFVPGVAGNNQFFVFALSDTDLGATFAQQQIPEPKSLALVLLGLGAVGFSSRRKPNRAP